jgi:hypothetical protein
MSHYKIGCDAHKRYSQFAILDHEGRFLQQVRVNHIPGAIRDFLEDYPPGTPVALESVGNWYWIVNDAKQRRDTKPPGASRLWRMRRRQRS